MSSVPSLSTMARHRVSVSQDQNGTTFVRTITKFCQITDKRCVMKLEDKARMFDGFIEILLTRGDPCFYSSMPVRVRNIIPCISAIISYYYMDQGLRCHFQGQLKKLYELFAKCFLAMNSNDQRFILNYMVNAINQNDKMSSVVEGCFGILARICKHLRFFYTRDDTKNLITEKFGSILTDHFYVFPSLHDDEFTESHYKVLRMMFNIFSYLNSKRYLPYFKQPEVFSQWLKGVNLFIKELPVVPNAKCFKNALCNAVFSAAAVASRSTLLMPKENRVNAYNPIFLGTVKFISQNMRSLIAKKSLATALLMLRTPNTTIQGMIKSEAHRIVTSLLVPCLRVYTTFNIDWEESRTNSEDAAVRHNTRRAIHHIVSEISECRFSVLGFLETNLRMALDAHFKNPRDHRWAAVVESCCCALNECRSFLQNNAKLELRVHGLFTRIVSRALTSSDCVICASALHLCVSFSDTLLRKDYGKRFEQQLANVVSDVPIVQNAHSKLFCILAAKERYWPYVHDIASSIMSSVVQQLENTDNVDTAFFENFLQFASMKEFYKNVTDHINPLLKVITKHYQYFRENSDTVQEHHSEWMAYVNCLDAITNALFHFSETDDDATPFMQNLFDLLYELSHDHHHDHRTRSARILEIFFCLETPNDTTPTLDSRLMRKYLASSSKRYVTDLLPAMKAYVDLDTNPENRFETILCFLTLIQKGLDDKENYDSIYMYALAWLIDFGVPECPIFHQCLDIFIADLDTSFRESIYSREQCTVLSALLQSKHNEKFFETMNAENRIGGFLKIWFCSFLNRKISKILAQRTLNAISKCLEYWKDIEVYTIHLKIHAKYLIDVIDDKIVIEPSEDDCNESDVDDDEEDEEEMVEILASCHLDSSEGQSLDDLDYHSDLNIEDEEYKFDLWAGFHDTGSIDIEELRSLALE